MLHWRKAEKLDELRAEDFAWWEQKYPYYFTVDYDGRPGKKNIQLPKLLILYWLIQQLQTQGRIFGAGFFLGLRGFNFRKYVLAGRVPEVLRYVYYGLEMITRNTDRQSHLTGIEYIHGTFVQSAVGYSHRNLACLGCKFKVQLHAHVMQ